MRTRRGQYLRWTIGRIAWVESWDGMEREEIEHVSTSFWKRAQKLWPEFRKPYWLRRWVEHRCPYSLYNLLKHFHSQGHGWVHLLCVWPDCWTIQKWPVFYSERSQGIGQEPMEQRCSIDHRWVFRRSIVVAQRWVTRIRLKNTTQSHIVILIHVIHLVLMKKANELKKINLANALPIHELDLDPSSKICRQLGESLKRYYFGYTTLSKRTIWTYLMVRFTMICWKYFF